MTVLLVALGAVVGAPARYMTDRAIQRRHNSVFPWGTLAVNVVGCFVLGILLGARTSTGVMALVGTGLCGALTTYSTFGYETYRLIRERALLLATLNVAVSLFAGLGAGFIGVAVGEAVVPWSPQL
jgi:CrcB protein